MKPGASSKTDVEVTTGLAPTFRQMVEPVQGGPAPSLPKPGQQIGDFELLRVLGQGSFGKVFLARQVSLDRQVALKVTANWGCEARTLARLEHEHIVQVFSESVESDHRLLCMQYVAGTTLERVIDSLQGRPHREWTGRAILEAIDRLSTETAALHPAALRGREWLTQDDDVQAVCRLGAQLAEALDYAHGRGILHRDIKPANILVSQYGRPLLMDFNLSSHHGPAAGRSRLGGTLAYMAPEHLDAFNPAESTPPEAVDQRSDIYALGVVLFELLTGQRPFPSSPAPLSTDERGDEAASLCATLRAMAAERRVQEDLCRSPRRINPDVPPTLDRAIRCCLDPDPAHRYQTAGELARALEGCGELRRVEREAPAPGPLTRAALRHPFLLLAVLTLLPHVLGSAVNIAYNALRIVSSLTTAQQVAFTWLVLGYNLVMYPVCLAILVGLVVPAWRTWRDLGYGRAVSGVRPAPDRVAAVRRGVLRWPLWAVAVSCLGWLPGGMVFPLAIVWLAGPVDAEVFGHFVVSFTLSGLIALTYSFFAVQFMALRVFYPRLWVDGRDFGPTTRAELGSVAPRLRAFQLLAGVIPLAGAVLLIGVGPETSGYRTFRLLATALIALGMAGFGLAAVAHNVLSQTLAVLTRAEGAPSARGVGSCS
jgi:serine/threonine protein kinase